jgi:hypothetical protein
MDASRSWRIICIALRSFFLDRPLSGGFFGGPRDFGRWRQIAWLLFGFKNGASQLNEKLLHQACLKFLLFDPWRAEYRFVCEKFQAGTQLAVAGEPRMESLPFDSIAGIAIARRNFLGTWLDGFIVKKWVRRGLRVE